MSPEEESLKVALLKAFLRWLHPKPSSHKRGVMQVQISGFERSVEAAVVAMAAILGYRWMVGRKVDYLAVWRVQHCLISLPVE